MTRMSATISRSTTEHGRRSSAARSALSRDVPAAASMGELAHAANCPTCLAAGTAALDALPGAQHPGVLPAQCPTCGVTSVEYGLLVAIDAVLADMSGLALLDAATDTI